MQETKDDGAKEKPADSVDEKKSGKESSPAPDEGIKKKLPEEKKMEPATLDVVLSEVRRIQREIWYTRVALALFLVISLVFTKLCISDVNDTLGIFLQFMMSTMSGGAGGE